MSTTAVPSHNEMCPEPAADPELSYPRIVSKKIMPVLFLTAEDPTDSAFLSFVFKMIARSLATLGNPNHSVFYFASTSSKKVLSHRKMA